MTSASPSRGRVVASLDRAAQALRGLPVPQSAPLGEMAIAAHVAAKVWRDRASPGALRRALVDAAFIGATLQTFGRGGAVAQGGALHPLAFLPDYHGPHFHRALRRLVTPAEGPFVVHLALTGACPWRCLYCYASAGGAHAPDAGDAALERIAAELAARRVPIVILGGGEPLARFDRAVRIVEILSRGCEVRLATSGAGLTPARASRLRDAGVRVLAISLDSDERARVDQARGPGAFDAATRALEVSARVGMVSLVTSIVGRDAFASEREVARFLTWMRAVHPAAVVNFVPQFSVGRAAGDGFRTPAEFAPVARRLAAVIRGGRHRASVFYAAPMDLMVGCVGAAQRQAIVDIRGNLGACVAGATFGNLVTEPFDVVWARLLAAPSRFKQGYFCAHVAERAAAPEPGPGATYEALEDFMASHPDALLQRALDLAGPALAWLVSD